MYILPFKSFGIFIVSIVSRGLKRYVSMSYRETMIVSFCCFLFPHRVVLDLLT